MANGAPNRKVYDDKILPSNANARNKSERRTVLSIAINVKWANQDIDAIERFEPDGKRHYYGMWRR